MEKTKLSMFLTVLLSVVLLFSFGCLAPAPAEAEYEPPTPSLERPTYPSLPSSPSEDITKYSMEKPFEIGFIDVGYGDATLIRTDSKSILFDAGPSFEASKVKQYLKERGVVSIDVLVLSSNDPLFVSGAPDIMRSLPVKEIWVPQLDYESDPFWNQIITLARDSQVKVVEYGHKYSDGNLTLSVLNPFPGSRNVNPATDSIVLKAQYGDFCAIMFSNSVAGAASGSDAGTVFGGVDNRIISGSDSAKCQVLRVSAHGSGNSASFQLLDAMGPPEIAVISVGPNPPANNYPEPALIRRLLLRDIKVYITDKLGDVEIKSDGSEYTASSSYPYSTSYAQFINEVGYAGGKYYR